MEKAALSVQRMAGFAFNVVGVSTCYLIGVGLPGVPRLAQLGAYFVSVCCRAIWLTPYFNEKGVGYAVYKETVTFSIGLVSIFALMLILGPSGRLAPVLGYSVLSSSMACAAVSTLMQFVFDLLAFLMVNRVIPTLCSRAGYHYENQMQIAEKDRQLQQYQRIVEQLNREKEPLATKGGEAEALRDELQREKEQLATKEKEAEALREQLATKGGEAEALRDELQREKEQLATKEKEAEALREQLATKGGEAKALGDELQREKEQLATKGEEIKALGDELQREKEQLATKEKEAEALREQLATKEKEAEALREQLATKGGEAEALGDELQREKEQLATKGGEAEALRDELQREKEQLATKEKEAEALREQLVEKMKKFEEISLDINLVIQGFKTDDGISEQQLETLFKQFQQVLNRLSAISFRSTEMREDLVKVAAPPPQSPLDDEQGVTDDMVGISSLPSRELTPPSQDGENSTDSLLQENGIGPSSCEAASEVQQKGVLSDTFKVLLKSKILVVQAANGALSSKIDRRKESSEIAEAKEKVQNSLKQMRELLDQGKEQLEGMQDGDDKDCWQALFDQMEAKCLEQENLFKKYCEV